MARSRGSVRRRGSDGGSGRAKINDLAYNSDIHPTGVTETRSFMRRIGTFSDESRARRFGNYLLTRSVDSVLQPGPDPTDAQWEIWVLQEDDVDTARRELAEFCRAPDDQRFIVDQQADRIRHQQVDQQWQRRQQLAGKVAAEETAGMASRHDKAGASPATSQAAGESGEPLPGSTTLLEAEMRQQNMPVTIAIIVMSIVASFSCNFAAPRGSRIPGKVTVEQQVYDGLSFVDRRAYAQTQDPFASIARGQLWRVITPMFLHGNMFHLFFNMFWIYLLGSMIERIHGSWLFLVLVLLTQSAGMMVQVLLPENGLLIPALRGTPFAIGASGAAYGLFGFLWIRPFLDKDYPIELDSTQVSLLLISLVVCMTPLVTGVANGAHLGGLAAGLMIGAVSHWIHR